MIRVEVTWRRNTDTPARMYESTDGRFTIIWDPAGRTEGEAGGWCLLRESEHLGTYPLLRAAKEAAADA
jgi:hypothetical protein